MSNDDIMSAILERPNLMNVDTKHIWGKFVDLHESLVILYDESVETGNKLQQILDMYLESENKGVKKVSKRKAKIAIIESSEKLDFE